MSEPQSVFTQYFDKVPRRTPAAEIWPAVFRAYARDLGASEKLADAVSQAAWKMCKATRGEYVLLHADRYIRERVTSSTVVAEPTTRRFQLVRTEDVSGVSGTGIVAEGVVFADGTVAMRWNTTTASTAVYSSIQDVTTIHGHGGVTTVRMVD